MEKSGRASGSISFIHRIFERSLDSVLGFVVIAVVLVGAILFMVTYASGGLMSIDSVPPTVSIVAPQQGAQVSGIVSFGVYATDDSGVQEVDLYPECIGKPIIITKPPYNTSWDTRGAAEGQHKLCALVRDIHGLSTKTQIEVTVKNR